MNKFQKNLFNEVKHGYSTLCLRCQFQYFQWTWRVANNKYYLISLTQPSCRNTRLELAGFLTLNLSKIPLIVFAFLKRLQIYKLSENWQNFFEVFFSLFFEVFLMNFRFLNGLQRYTLSFILNKLLLTYF